MKRLTLLIVLLFVLLLGCIIGWWVKALDGVGWNYVEETLRNQSENINDLQEYIKKRRDYDTDIEAFKELNLIFDEQHNGEYLPWVFTDLGLVKFDDRGFVEKICYLPSVLNDPDCPPNL